MVLQNDDVILLAQLVAEIDSLANQLENAYSKSDKKKFDSAKTALLDIQNKITFLLKGQ